MAYTIVEEEYTVDWPEVGTVFHYSIMDSQYIMDRAKTLEEATKIAEELERYDDIRGYLEEEISFLVGQFQYKFDLDSTEAYDKFQEYVKDWL